MNKEEIRKKVGNKIRTRREELGLSQEQLATLIGYKTRGAVSKLENGDREISFKKMMEISKALQVDEKYFWVGQEPTNVKWSKDLGKRLRELRASILLDKLESEININKAEITRFEEGNLSPSNNDLMKYSNYFKIDINYLLGHTNVKTIYSNSNNLSTNNTNTEIDKINKILVNIENRYLKEILEILEILNKNKNFEKLINIKPLIK